jgi:NETI protein
MSKEKKKMNFEVQENETIEECLERIKKLGYVPTRRTEKPIFQEVIKGSETAYEPVGRQIIFEAKIIDKSEH